MLLLLLLILYIKFKLSYYHTVLSIDFVPIQSNPIQSNQLIVFGNSCCGLDAVGLGPGLD